MKALTAAINKITVQAQGKPSFLLDSAPVKRMSATIRKYIEREVKERRRKIAQGGSDKHFDFLQLLINARDKQDQEWSAESISNRMLTLIFAAFDTSAATLNLLLLELASPSCREFKRRVQAEIDSIPISQGALTTEIITEKAPLIKACMYEAMRRPKPVISAPMRMVVNEDFHVPVGPGADGIRQEAVIPKGCILTHPILFAHHDPKSYPVPEVFDPVQNQLNNPNGTNASGVASSSLGFGIGRNQCPGRFFAAEEVQLATVVFFRCLDITAETDYKQKHQNGTLLVAHPLPVRVTLKPEGERLFREIRNQKAASKKR